MSRDDIIKTIKECWTESGGVQFLQCGSSIDNPQARDVDIMVYTCYDLESFFDDLVNQFKDKQIIKTDYIKIWNMYSFKIMEGDEVISFHIVSFYDLMNYVEKAGETESYTDVNLFSLSMKLPSVYRKWILDTKHLAGDRYLREQLKAILERQQIPTVAICTCLKKRIVNSINYYSEKGDSDLFSGIIISQIFNDAVLYCYAENSVFYGTLKYLERDMKSFRNHIELSEKTVGLFYSINREKPDDIIVQLHEIQELL